MEEFPDFRDVYKYPGVILSADEIIYLKSALHAYRRELNSETKELTNHIHEAVINRLNREVERMKHAD